MLLFGPYLNLLLVLSSHKAVAIPMPMGPARHASLAFPSPEVVTPKAQIPYQSRPEMLPPRSQGPTGPKTSGVHIFLDADAWVEPNEGCTTDIPISSVMSL